MKSFHDKNYKIGFIGGGHICEALVRGFILSGYIDPGMIYVSTLERNRREELHQRLGVVTDCSNTEIADFVDVLFLSVRPMELLKVCKEISSHLSKDVLIVSVAAGVNLSRITEALDSYKNVVRIMPNLPARIRSSTTVVYANPGCNTKSFADFKEFISGIGEVIEIKKENLIDPVTVLSGSAPAYYVMIADALIKYGVSEGIPEDICNKLVLDTMEGSAQWAMHSKESPSELWPKVVTKGGITAAGMEVFDSSGLIDIFVKGLVAATNKARSIDKMIEGEKL